MTEAILNWHGQDAPPTYQCGSKAIDSIFVTNGLLGHPSGYLSGLADVSGDHHCLWIDLPEQWFFGGNMPVIVWPGAWQLKSDDPRTCKCYLKNLEAFFTEHLLLQKIQQIKSDLLTQQLQPHQDAKLKCLDDLWIQGMLQAECQCWKLHTQPYGWTLELTQLMAEIKYWHTSLWQAEGQQVNAWLMYHLARVLSLPLLPSTSAEYIGWGNPPTAKEKSLTKTEARQPQPLRNMVGEPGNGANSGNRRWLSKTSMSPTTNGGTMATC